MCVSPGRYTLSLEWKCGSPNGSVGLEVWSHFQSSDEGLYVLKPYTLAQAVRDGHVYACFAVLDYVHRADRPHPVLVGVAIQAAETVRAVIQGRFVEVEPGVVIVVEEGGDG